MKLDSWYTVHMNDKLIINTNPHLRDPKKRIEAVCRMVESSSAVEGIHVKITPILQESGEYRFNVQHKKQDDKE